MIKVENLTFQYPGTDGFGLRDLHFSIEKGEVFGFLGPSGSGKSTTQKVLFKLLKGYEGSVFIDGTELKDWDDGLYQKIGVGFELPNHYLKLSALENLNFFRAFYPSTLEPMKLLEMVGLQKDASKKVGNFSKGMKMRLNFVRSFMHDPDILFLDEPTSGMDPGNARMIKNIIKDLKSRGKTVFINTHQMHDAEELCDRVAFIVDGQIEALDSPQNLKLAHSNRKVEVILKDEDTTRVFDLDNLGVNEEFISLIRDRDIATIHSKEANLDDVFIKVTGKELVN